MIKIKFLILFFVLYQVIESFDIYMKVALSFPLNVILFYLLIFVSILIHELVHLTIFVIHGIKVTEINVSLLKVKNLSEIKNTKFEINKLNIFNIFSGSVCYNSDYNIGNECKKKYLGLVSSYVIAPMSTLTISLTSMVILKSEWINTYYGNTYSILKFIFYVLFVFNLIIFFSSLLSNDNYTGDLRAIINLMKKNLSVK